MLKDDVLSALEREKGRLVAGGQLADALGVSRTAVWKAIRQLRGEGAEISSIPNKGYLLHETNDTLSLSAIGEGLTTAFIGRRMELLPTVHSTNSYLKEADTDSLPDGFAVIADGQTLGRGRRNRVFLSPKGGGVYLSVLLKPGELAEDISFLTIRAAVAVSRAIEKVCGIRADIKWVNDVYCRGKKICGILTEAVLSAELREVSAAIIGIGVNTGAVPEELGGIATSIWQESNRRGLRNRLAAEILNQLEAVYPGSGSADSKRDIVSYYNDRLFIKGREVTVTDRGAAFRATALGIDGSGALLVRDERGDERAVTTGEITII
jgi:BirA family biotin operon repressor/biotin-[acetyl-CoA-carboxylase] ligase